MLERIRELIDWALEERRRLAEGLAAGRRAARRVLTALQPAEGGSRFDRAYQLASLEAANSGRGDVLLPKLDNVRRTRLKLLEEAAGAIEQDAAHLASWDRYEQQLNQLRAVVHFQLGVSLDAPSGPPVALVRKLPPDQRRMLAALWTRPESPLAVLQRQVRPGRVVREDEVRRIAASLRDSLIRLGRRDWTIDITSEFVRLKRRRR